MIASKTIKYLEINLMMENKGLFNGNYIRRHQRMKRPSMLVD
jgi:hypothetical protein